MKTIEKVFFALRKQGIDSVVDRNMLSFSYRKLNGLYLQDEQDENYFSMYLPGIFEIDEQNEQTVLQLINKINGNMRMVKLAVYGRYVWIGVELPVYKETLVEEIVAMTLEILYEAWQQFLKLAYELSDLEYMIYNTQETVRSLQN